MPHFAGIRCCVFDAYGTLFDVHSAMAPFRERLGAQAEALSAVWRRKQLEYTWLRALMQRHADFEQVTREALAFAFAAHGRTDPDLQDALVAAYRALACYPDVPGALARLRAAGVRTAILSNGTPDMLAAAARHSGLDGLLDAVYSVEAAGVFKPHPSVYRIAVDREAAAVDEILFLSTNAWDVAGAAAFGMRVVWINRFGQPPEHLPAGPEAVITTLADLPALLDPYDEVNDARHPP